MRILSSRMSGASLVLMAILSVVPVLPGTVKAAPFGARSDDLATQSDDTPTRKRARIRLELAAAYFSQGNYPTALDEVKQVIAVDGSLSEAYELRGLIYSAMTEPKLAEESFRYALQLDGGNGSAMHNYAWMLCNQGRFAEADALFAKAVNYPKSIDTGRTTLARGVCQTKAGLLPDAEKTLQHAFELAPANPAAAYNMANVLYLRGDYDRARFYIRRVNDVAERVTPDSLWLGVRIEQKLGNAPARDELAATLRNRFPNSREAIALELGRFND
ncbi:type IV pilus biogenesis/stability protein PilW [Aquabacterium sp.]|uniref:type IV pilus biogenesis/stability protein PilW n=1 Tax=Aquabacterium sp. TaxID=1872578 RepID=UPI0035B280B7